MEKQKTELLAPAKDKETAIEAINCGADAIYIGAKSFGARKNAGNSIEDIKDIVDYAHKFYVKVFVTVNTILTDSELHEAQKLIKELYKIGVDAIITQDMGILKNSIENKIPPIRIHISTQCNNRTKEKVKFFEEMNIPRVILARELSLEQIKEIKDYAQNTEIETFIHGALCVSYSGQCYLSNYIGGRSANRGECAQPCRKKYSLCDKDGNYIIKNKHLLSLKDFNASKYLENLVNIGVKSFKIEGRLKDKNYVRNVVLYYRGLLDKYSKKESSGKIFYDGFTPNIEKTFNRGYTSYFLNGREECFNFESSKSIGEKLGSIKKSLNNCYIIETNQKINPQDGLCYYNEDGELVGFKVNKIENNNNYPNNHLFIPSGTVVYRNQDTAFEKLLSNTKIERKIGCKISIQNNEIIITDEDNNQVKHLLQSGEKPKNQEKANENFITQLKKTGNSDFYIHTLSIDQDMDFYPISVINEIRRNLFEELMTERIKNYPKKLYTPLKYSNYPKAIGDYRENVANNEAKEFYKNSNCKIEEYAPEINKPNRQIELMRTKHCIKWAINKCKSKEELFLEDEKGVKYPLKFDCKNCEMIILSPQ